MPASHSFPANQTARNGGNLTSLHALLRDAGVLVETFRKRDGRPRPVVATGWDTVDHALMLGGERGDDTLGAGAFARPAGGLLRGAVHEWIGLAGEDGASSPHRLWTPPLTILAHLCRRALNEPLPDEQRATTRRASKQLNAPAAKHQASAATVRAVWIGRHVWPEPWTLDDAGDGATLLNQCLFVDPPDAQSRLWAIDLSLRCPALSAVIADGSGLDMAASRRLQLAAEAGGHAIGLIARPPRERDILSAATTRWLVAHHPTTLAAPTSPDHRHRPTPRWSMELLRHKGKGVRLPTTARRSDRSDDATRHRCRWIVEEAIPDGPDAIDRSRYALHPPAGLVRLSAHAGDGSASTTASLFDSASATLPASRHAG